MRAIAIVVGLTTLMTLVSSPASARSADPNKKVYTGEKRCHSPKMHLVCTLQPDSYNTYYCTSQKGHR